MRAGANRKLAEDVAQKVYQQTRDGMHTRQVYKLVLSSLSHYKDGSIIKHRYRLKESIMMLGPSGFRFEDYVSNILAHYGYTDQSVRTSIDGRCVTHEVDISAKLPQTEKRVMIECKYHNLPGIFTGLKESLYTHARFLDLSNHFDREMLVCNTKVSRDVITYSNCIGQDVISWRYPPNKGLEKMIQDKGLYALTILPLNEEELLGLSKNKIMTAKDLLEFNASQLSSRTGIRLERINKLQDLAKQILDKF